MTISVSSTATANPTGPGLVILLEVSGDLYGWQWPKVASIVVENDGASVDRIVLDVSGLRSCEREALVELVAIRGRPPASRRSAVDVVGIPLGQFADALGHGPDAIPQPRPGGGGRHRRPEATTPTTTAPAVTTPSVAGPATERG